MLNIIVPVHNRLSSTMRFLRSLREQSYKELKILIIDDGSTDGTTNYIRSACPEVEVLRGNGELWWGGAINLGLNRVRVELTNNDWIAFANNDITMEPNFIETIMRYCASDLSAMCHPIVCDERGVCTSSGSLIVSWAAFLTRHPFRGCRIEQLPKNEKRQIDLATARFLVFHSSLLSSVGSIDVEHFPHYLGDHDFSIRAQKKGYRVCIVTDALCQLDMSTSGNNPDKIHDIKTFVRSLFDIKSTNQLKPRYVFGIKHCPIYFLFFYFISVTCKVVLNFLVNMVIHHLMNNCRIHAVRNKIR